MHAVTRYRPLLGLLLMLLAPLGEGRVAATVSATEPGGAAGDRLAVGEVAPEIVLPSLRSGQNLVRLSDYRGKVVYLDFWSSWCGPCRRAMPRLDALRQEYSRSDFEVVGVNVDPTAADGRRFLERTPVSYPVALDANGDLARRLGVEALPALFIVDRDGVVRNVMRGSGVESRDVLEARLSELIEQQEVQ